MPTHSESPRENLEEKKERKIMKKEILSVERLILFELIKIRKI